MNKIKVNLDRKTLSSDYIESKQDFKQVTSQVHASNAILKSTWFYGSIGLASLATIVTLSVKSSNTPLNEENTTLKNSITTASFIAPLSSNKEDKQVKLNFPIVKKESKNQVAAITVVPVITEPAPIVVKKIQKQDEIIQEAVAEQPRLITKTPVPPKKEEVKKNYIPKIAGVYNGEIRIQELCANGIEVNSDVKITSFTLNYSTNKGDKALNISGSKVPSGICNEMYSYGIDQMIFITDIVGQDPNGKYLRFVPMNLTAVID